MALPSVQETLIGNIGQIGELRELQNDNAVINFSIAVTQRRRKGNEWVDGETIWTNCVIWGRDARAFNAQQFQPGTQLMVVGHRSATRRPAYTNKQGQEVPERVQQEVIVDAFGPAVTPFVKITVTRLQKNGSQGGQSRPANNSNTSTPQQSAQQQNNSSAASDDPFGDPSDLSDPFGSDSSDDPFGDGGDPF